MAELRRQLLAFRPVAALAPDWTERLRQYSVFVTFFLANRSGFKVHRAFTMIGTYGRLVVRDQSEMLVIREVLVDGTYDDEALPDEVDLVLDVGCNIGAAALWFAVRYPHAQIVGVEADPYTAAIARHNLEGRANTRVVSAAVSDKRGYETLRVAVDSWMSSTVGPAGDGIQVPAVLLDELVDEAGPRRLLKIDVEGAEHAAFRGSRRLREFEFITGEYHPVDGESWDKMVASLEGFAVVPGPTALDGRRTFAARRLA